jgi:hypothetical protein
MPIRLVLTTKGKVGAPVHKEWDVHGNVNIEE